MNVSMMDSERESSTFSQSRKTTRRTTHGFFYAIYKITVDESSLMKATHFVHSREFSTISQQESIPSCNIMVSLSCHQLTKTDGTSLFRQPGEEARDSWLAFAG